MSDLQNKVLLEVSPASLPGHQLLECRQGVGNSVSGGLVDQVDNHLNAILLDELDRELGALKLPLQMMCVCVREDDDTVAEKEEERATNLELLLKGEDGLLLLDVVV